MLIAKLYLDIFISLTALIALLPLIALVSLLIYIGMGPPIFFCQLRPGLSGRPFKIIKFRTMNLMRNQQGHLLSDAARLTPLGRFLRSASLDELPEFINVLRGDMSLVGPRPLLMQYLAHYSREQARRHDVKPGITGLTQVSGRNALSWAQKFSLDVWYIDHWSLWMDIKILGRTVWKAIKREGIHQPGCATMDEFMGSEIHEDMIANHKG